MADGVTLDQLQRKAPSGPRAAANPRQLTAPRDGGRAMFLIDTVQILRCTTCLFVITMHSVLHAPNLKYGLLELQAIEVVQSR